MKSFEFSKFVDIYRDLGSLIILDRTIDVLYALVFIIQPIQVYPTYLGDCELQGMNK